MYLLLQESALSEALARLAGDIDQKLDRLELDPLKDYFGEYWRYFLSIFYEVSSLTSRCSGKGPGLLLGKDLRKPDWKEPWSRARGVFWEISALGLDSANQPGAYVLQSNLGE